MAINGTPPYKAVLTHGFTVDEHGRKQSKSLGNVITPDEVIGKDGADVLRLWIAATDFSAEMSVSKEILARTSDSYRRIRNTLRYLLANLDGFDPSQDTVAFKDMLALDRWMVDRTAQIQKDIIKAYDNYQFHLIYQKLHNFCVVDLSSFYIDIIRDRQYTMQTKSLGRRSAQSALYQVAEAVVRWIAPILCFTADEIWALLPGDRSVPVFAAEWQPLQELTAEALGRDYWREITKVKAAINKVLEAKRNEEVIGGPLEADITLYADETWHKVLSEVGNELRFVLLTSSAVLKPLAEANSEAEATDISGIKINVEPTPNQKCERCFHRVDDVGNSKDHPTLCGRCIVNVDGDGENRRYV